MKKLVFTAVFAALAAAFTYNLLFAEDAVGSTVLEKMQQVLDKQDQILARLDALQEELRIVKVRTTLNS
ncbi:MAG TPA: hypothetical protein VL404_04555 [Candidatus Eisenbacteria bacterium]|jgi:hypothetical protein|nr:hypothetical protein [Candidatus Eisenbacteria bacterium]